MEKEIELRVDPPRPSDNNNKRLLLQLRVWDRSIVKYMHRAYPGNTESFTDVGAVYETTLETFHEHDCGECSKSKHKDVCNYTNLWLFDGEETQEIIMFALRGLVRLALAENEEQVMVIKI